MNTRETTLSFAVADDEQDVVVVDRSRLERYATCPAQARFIDSGLVLDESLAAATGDAVHQAFSGAIERYLDDPTEHYSAYAEAAMSGLRSARPDIQPGALGAGRPAVWAWAKYLSNHSANNVIRYDGGEGERSGQLAVDLPFGDLTLRITSELDLLLATPAKQVLREVDYKSGWKRHGIESIAASFQFGLHAWLVLHNYPDVEALEVSVWNTRTNTLTYPVTFDRSRLKEIETRIRSAAGEYTLYRNRTPEETPTWPAVEKCSTCSAACLCTAALHTADVAKDPAGYVRELIALDAKLTAMTKLAADYVDKHGDIVTPDGCFGRSKPKAVRKQPTAIYQAVETDGDDE